MALLLSSFTGGGLTDEESEDENNQIPIAIDRIKRFFKYLTNSFLNLFKRKKTEVHENGKHNSTIDMNNEEGNHFRKLISYEVFFNKFEN